MLTKILANPIGQHRIHDPRMNPKGGAIQFTQKPATNSHQPQTFAGQISHRVSPHTVHAAVIQGAAPSFAQRAEGGIERKGVKPEGMRMADLTSSAYPGLNFSNLYKSSAQFTEIDFSTSHSVTAIQEGLKDEGAQKFKTWNILLQRGDHKYVLKIFIDAEDKVKVGKGLGNGYKSRTLFSEASGNLFINGNETYADTETASLLINGFKDWDDNTDTGQYFPPIYAEISGDTLTFRFISKATFDVSHEDGVIAIKEVTTTLTSSAESTAPTPSTTAAALAFFPSSDLMRSAMEMAGVVPAIIDAALTNAYLLTTLAGMGVTELADQKALIEALDLKANMNDLGSIQEALAKFDAQTISFLQEAKSLGNTKLYPALREMAALGFEAPAERVEIVRIFDLANNPMKIMDVLSTLVDFDFPINFTVLKNAKAAGDISLYPLLNQLHADGIKDLTLAQTLIKDFDLSTSDLKADGHPKYTAAMGHYRAFAGKAYSTETVTEAKTWAMDDSIQVPDVIGVLINFLDGKDSADKDLIYGAFMVAFSNSDQNSLTAILGFGKAYAGVTTDQRESARDLLSGYTEGDYGSASGKDRFVRLLQKQTP